MRKRTWLRVKAFFKRWRAWIPQLIVYLLLLVRDNFTTQALSWMGEKYEGIVTEFFLRYTPQGISEWALLILVVSVVVVILYDVIDTRKNITENSEAETRQAASKKDYQIATILTELNENGIELACIQVTANENIRCVAKIESIVELRKRGSRKKEEENLVNTLNPRGSFLLWLSNLREYTDLKKDVPDSITTVTAHKDIARLGFRWEGSDNHRLDGTRYEIGVRIYREENGLIDMGLVKGVLSIKTEQRVDGGITKKLHWINNR